MIVIRTPRLILRDHVPEDLPQLHEILSDPAVTWYIPSMHMDSVEATRAYLDASMLDATRETRLRCNLAVADPDGTLLGEVGLHFIDGIPGCAHWGLGYYLRSDRWNRGLATESVHAALTYAFARDVCRISASCLAENLGSRRVLERCGFTQEGLLKAHTWHDARWKDCAVYRLLKEEYCSAQSMPD